MEWGGGRVIDGREVGRRGGGAGGGEEKEGQRGKEIKRKRCKGEGKDGS